MKRYHRRRPCSHTSPRRSPTMVTLHDAAGFVECRWWNDGWTVKTVVTWRSSASMILAHSWIVFLPFKCTASLDQWLRRPSRERQTSAWIFSRSSHTKDLKTGNPVAALQGFWHYRPVLGMVGPVSVCTMNGWGRKFDLQLLFHRGSTYNCLSRSVPEIQ